MKLFTNKKKLRSEIRKINNISLVPTMGALHKGHESIIRKSVKGSGKTLVSIFINPKQFNNRKDLKNYPRNNKNDIKILKRLKIDYLYKPSYTDIYKFKTKNKIYLDKFSKKLCGQFRKGHFRGVINVVNRLLEITKPKKILLGNKDFQQLYLIKKHIKKNRIKTKVLPCKTVRDKNFIAFSSRLKKLNAHEKTKLIRIIKVLKKYKKDLITKKEKYSFSLIKKKIISLGAKKVDYIKIIDLNTLKKPNKNKFNLFYAIYIGNIRLIDNFQFKKKIDPIPRKDKKPITSVIVVTNTLEANAGSILNFFKDTGTKIPNKPATIIFKIIATAIKIERSNSLNQN